MRAKLKVLFIVLLVAAAAVAAFLLRPKAVGRPAPAGPAPEAAFSVQAAAAGRSTLRAYIDVSGDVQAATSVEAFPDIGGRLASLSAALGDTVEKGQVIAQVDPSLPGSMYSLAPVRAPIAGVVTDLAADVGDKVSASTAIATVGILSRLEVKTLIRERDVGDVRVGQRAVLRFEAFPGRSFEARVSRLSPVLDKTSRTMSATISIEGDKGRVAPGMFARARVYTAVYADVVAIPEEAAFDRFGEQCAYVVDRRDGVDRARLAKLETGARIDGLVEVRSGIAEGERVVVAGRSALGDGALVRVVSGGKAPK
jgi:multidrug efflux pump subunit AcrA (membrane-fusion protein)